MSPGFAREHIGGVRRVFQTLSLFIRLPRFDRGDFGVNRDHGVAKPVEFVFRFALGRLDHHGAGHRPGNGGRMKTIIHQALGDIFHRDTLELAQVENAFVRDQPARACDRAPGNNSRAACAM